MDKGKFKYFWFFRLVFLESFLGSKKRERISIGKKLASLLHAFVMGKSCFNKSIMINGVTFVWKLFLEKDYPPVARAGKDIILTLPHNSATLYGNGSTDDKVNILTSSH